MRSVIYGVLITVFLASAGTVQAGNDLDGKALLCNSNDITHPVYGLVFEKGKVKRWEVSGYSKKVSYSVTYELPGIKKVRWRTYRWFNLNRETLKVGSDQCRVLSKTAIFLTLDVIIAAGKKMNKL
jgi:hypothetical protein